MTEPRNQEQEPIEFLCLDRHYDDIPHPRPANNDIPEWFKNMENSFGEDQKSTVTQCRPFLDALSMGWIVPLAGNVVVKANENGQLNFKWDTDIPLMHRQEEGVMGKHSPYGNVSIFQWLSPWKISVPDNYSVLVTAPMNRRESRFSVFSGVIDADQRLFNLNCPFVWDKVPYAGVVEAGTPIIQVIPFNRSGIISDGEIRPMDDSEVEEAKENQREKNERPSRYKNDIWIPKTGSRIVDEG